MEAGMSERWYRTFLWVVERAFRPR